MRRGRPVGQSDILSAEELYTIIQCPDRRTKQGARDYAVLLALANTPMRKGELTKLKRENLIDEGDKKFITYQGLKKKSQRPYWLKIPITNEVYAGIQRYVNLDQRSPGDPLFYTLGKHGPYQRTSLTPKSVDCIVEKYVSQAGIKKRITAHSFRASYATLRIEGRDPVAIQELGGWSSITSMMPYLRRREEKKNEAALAFSFS